MKKLTELDLQNALDECELIRFNTHGDWLAGMVKRLNKALGHVEEKKRIVIKTGLSAEPECKS